MEALGEEDVLDPNPDIHALFCYYNSLYFSAALGACSVSWSNSRMTRCAGVCHYRRSDGCEIRLSEPLLKFRPTADLKNTLLHEMIHAFLWIENRNRDHSDHGPDFQRLMNDINCSSVDDHQRPAGGYNITIYHDFYAEVENYQVHQWMCESCGDLIKRAMNRAPSASDCIQKVKHHGSCSNPYCHWHRHKKECSGRYTKIAEPPGYEGKGLKGHQGRERMQERRLGGNPRATPLLFSSSLGRRQARAAASKEAATASGCGNGEQGFLLWQRWEEQQLRRWGVKTAAAAAGSSNGDDGQSISSGGKQRHLWRWGVKATAAVAASVNDGGKHKHQKDGPKELSHESGEKAAKPHTEVDGKDKPDAKRIKTITNFFPVVDNENLGKDKSSLTGDSRKHLCHGNSKGIVPKLSEDLVPEQIARGTRTHASRRKRKFTNVAQKYHGRENKYTVMSRWLDWYVEEEEEGYEDIEPLINKRTERRKKQRTLVHLKRKVIEDERIPDAASTEVTHPEVTETIDPVAAPSQDQLDDRGASRLGVSGFCRNMDTLRDLSGDDGAANLTQSEEVNILEISDG